MTGVTLPTPVVWVLRLLVLAAFFGTWEWGSHAGYLAPVLFGRPSRIAEFLYTEVFVTGSLLLDFGYTIAATFLAFSLGSASGILFGMLSSRGRTSRRCSARS
jgi:NitT/TauT family transport system permease protein